MIQLLEKTATSLIVIGLVGLFIVSVMPEPVSGSVTVSATVSSTMISCSTEASALSFAADLDNNAVGTTTEATTSVQSSGTVYMKVYDSGDTSANPGLYKDPDLIESPNAAYDATATLAAGTEGYGMQATNSSGTAMVLAPNYDWASDTDVVGGIGYDSGGALTVASSGSAISDPEQVDISFRAAVSATTPGGAYSDTITITCTSS